MEIVVRSAKERPSRDGLATHPRRDPRRALEDVRQTKRVALPSDIQITAKASMSLDCVVNPLRVLRIRRRCTTGAYRRAVCGERRRRLRSGERSREREGALAGHS